MATTWTPRHSARHASNWAGILAYGVLLIGIGVFALIQPFAADLATGLVIATVMIFAGVAALSAGFSNRGWHNRWLDMLIGLMAIGVGGLAVWHPFLAAFSLVWFIGAWLMTVGIFELVAGFNATTHRWPLILIANVDIALGLYLLLAGPATALIILAVLLGFSFLVRGALLSLFALRIRSLG